MIQTTITKGNCFHQNQPKNREKGITYLKLPPQTNHIPTTDQHQLNPEQNLICAGLAGKPLLCFPGADPADTNPDSEAKSSLAGVWGACAGSSSITQHANAEQKVTPLHMAASR